jgi:hypothetical protein
MNYMTEVDAWFQAELDRFQQTGDKQRFLKALKDKILQSYRNGLRAKRSEKKPESSTSKYSK